ncbi:hypothetical protein PG991_000761 [Apiospora marii]|uniref:Uncharacterized protein n=1 Tax=Apiospora marii TaxID=335849 RepID=A0ABR1SUP7_9PEZI
MSGAFRHLLRQDPARQEEHATLSFDFARATGQQQHENDGEDNDEKDEDYGEEEDVEMDPGSPVQEAHWCRGLLARGRQGHKEPLFEIKATPAPTALYDNSNDRDDENAHVANAVNSIAWHTRGLTPGQVSRHPKA